MKRYVVTALATVAVALFCAGGAYAQREPGDHEPGGYGRADRADRSGSNRDRAESASREREVNREPACAPKQSTKDKVFNGAVDFFLGPAANNIRDLDKVSEPKPEPSSSPRSMGSKSDPPDKN